MWRGAHGSQAAVARLLGTVEVVPLDEDLGRRAGVLLGRAKTADGARLGSNTVSSTPAHACLRERHVSRGIKRQRAAILAP